MNFAEMFCGIGGFRFGLEKNNQDIRWRKDIEGTTRQEDLQSRRIVTDPSDANSKHPEGFRCVWANDNDKYACQIYRKHYGNSELVEEDITKINPKTIPNFDLLTAGFPCQSFSLAGKRKGFQDIRGTMFYEVVRVASAKRPKLLLLENVKGLLSNDNGKTFGTILEELGNIGYWCEWQTLNSKHFGVPQNRERVFIVGHLRSEPSKQIFPIRQVGEDIDESCGEAQSHSGSGKERNLIERKVRIHRDDEKKSEIQGYSFFPETAEYIDVVDNHPKNILVANTVSHRYGKDGSENLLQIIQNYHASMDLGDGRPKRRTLRSGRVTELSVQNQRIRRLTPTECERLQGFSDGWTEGVSDTQRYKLLGNAVTTNVIQFLGEKLLEVLGV